ncbi:hypothetical protein [Bradyrhizobium diazoefficiens]|uniref:hypothetical protein n=1 Tax=Bradyrhizobium diazoefficiens TaxID=1355477 RepID=UPI001B6C6EE6|nr:hypothetical protein [Bradyrhizobium japonicum]
MNERARRRAMRNIVASLMMSNLTKHDVLEVAEEFLYGDFGHELGSMLRHMAMILPDVPSERYVTASSPEPPSLNEGVYELVQRKKMSKKALLEAIGSVAPKLIRSEQPTGTIRQLIEWFFDRATPTQSSRLVSLLSDAAQDPYLKGITRRG